MPGERIEQLDVLLGRIDAFPVVVAHGGDLEEPAGLDPGPVVGEFAGPRRSLAGRPPLADLVVDVLDLGDEQYALFDRLAGLTRDPDAAFAELTGAYAADTRLRVPATVYNAVLNRNEPVLP